MAPPGGPLGRRSPEYLLVNDCNGQRRSRRWAAILVGALSKSCAKCKSVLPPPGASLSAAKPKSEPPSHLASGTPFSCPNDAATRKQRRRGRGARAAAAEGEGEECRCGARGSALMYSNQWKVYVNWAGQNGSLQAAGFLFEPLAAGLAGSTNCRPKSGSRAARKRD